jgi:hypothetical protein
MRSLSEDAAIVGAKPDPTQVIDPIGSVQAALSHDGEEPIAPFYVS